ncbi:hypothetical protein NC653_039896 [Populus alba x Populus x berolinensis]|uniref:Uncharacterized protein n=1 Tax=Populus alba x Populus x berolinensis TaxID=444605 RepID=A0AAD6PSP2_9ROSI|nr:hypothetical protein NC653_039896 [Populus alba x Populus x berolinensis]
MKSYLLLATGDTCNVGDDPLLLDENHCRSSDSPLTFSLSLTVLCMVIGKRLGPRSNLLQIIRSPDESEILLLNRDGEEHTAVP